MHPAQPQVKGALMDPAAVPVAVFHSLSRLLQAL